MTSTSTLVTALGLWLLLAPSASAQEGALRLTVRYGAPPMIEGKVEAGARYVTGTCGGRPIWAPVEHDGRFSIPARPLATAAGPEPVLIAGTEVKVALGGLAPDQIDPLLRAALAEPTPQARAEALGALGSKLRAAGLPAMAAVVFSRALGERAQAGPQDARAWRLWWTWALEHAEALLALDRAPDAVALIQQEAMALDLSVGPNAVMVMSDQLFGLAQWHLSQGRPHGADPTHALALVDAAGALRQRAGRLPRRLPAAWTSPER
jgi:hypothetical protein